MITVNDSQIVVSESSSKGNQIKFYNNGYWVKIDNNKCNEGLAENFVSNFEAQLYDFPFVAYKSDIINYKGDSYNGCYSYNMYNDLNISFISLRRLFKKNNIPLNIFIKNESIEVNIKNVINTVGNLTGIDISTYLFRLLLLDALIINEDRHYMNLGICTNGHNYLNASCFDNGSSLFCTNWTYRKTKSLQENLNSAKSVARPFSKFFDKQVQACINLGAKPLIINKIGLDNLLTSYYNDYYNKDMNNLIKDVLRSRLDYYKNSGVYIYV